MTCNSEDSNCKFEILVKYLLLKLFEKRIRRGTQYVMNFMYLIKLIITGEKRTKCKYFKEDATNTPVVHFMIIISISQKAFRRPIPSSRDVLGKWWLRINSSAWAKVSKFDKIIFNQNILSRTQFKFKSLFKATYGLMSRWKMPFLCIWSIAFRTWYI